LQSGLYFYWAALNKNRPKKLLLNFLTLLIKIMVLLVAKEKPVKSNIAKAL
jgi:hypothetical protein